jgi:diguanylate cyclase (GGDEF)-like protein
MNTFDLLCLADDHELHKTFYKGLKKEFPGESTLYFSTMNPNDLITLSTDRHPAIVMIERPDSAMLETLEERFPLAPVLLVGDAYDDTQLLESADAEKIDAYLHDEADSAELHFTVQGLLNSYRHNAKIHLLLNEKKNWTTEVIRERKKMQQDFRQQMNLIREENLSLKKTLLACEKKAQALTGAHKEIEKLTQNNAKLYQQIKILSNQSSVRNILKIEIERAKRKKRELTLLILAIDKFSDLENEDEAAARGIVSRFKALLSANLRITDFISSATHGRFNVILTETDSDGAKKLVARFNQEVLTTCKTPHDTRLMVSFGITSFLPEDTVESMLKRAENALLKAQANGKSNTVCLPEE